VRFVDRLGEDALIGGAQPVSRGHDLSLLVSVFLEPRHEFRAAPPEVLADRERQGKRAHVALSVDRRAKIR
jgi:hypothetical protein